MSNLKNVITKENNKAELYNCKLYFFLSVFLEITLYNSLTNGKTGKIFSASYITEARLYMHISNNMNNLNSVFFTL